jgi:uncharacterized protein (DUF58 family)
MRKETSIHYQISWKPSGHQLGAKRGLSAGVGDYLRALVLLRDHPDPRRIDLRACIRDPFGHLWVRDFNLNTAFKVIVLLDASASMGYIGAVNRFEVAQDMIVQLAIAAYRSGDAFGLYAANTHLLKSATIPAKINQSAWLWAQQKLANIEPAGASAVGLLNIAPLLPRRRSLIFLISDFRWAEAQYKQLLKALNHHDVVPMMLQDPTEAAELPKRGIATIKDIETGQTQFLCMRPALKAKIEQAHDQHLNRIKTISYQYGVEPFLVNGAFNPIGLNQYFLARCRS